ncbi:hypothetical protein AOLI_G00192460 [Acnodon oligacanthus]
MRARGARGRDARARTSNELPPPPPPLLLLLLTLSEGYYEEAAGVLKDIWIRLISCTAAAACMVCDKPVRPAVTQSTS